MTGLTRRNRGTNLLGTLNTLADTIFDDGFLVKPTSSFNTGPQTNIVTNDDNYQIDVVVPGVPKEDLIVDINNNTLTVAFDQTKELGQTLTTSSFRKAWTLPENSNVETVNAKADNGILTITIPKITNNNLPKRNIHIE